MLCIAVSTASIFVPMIEVFPNVKLESIDNTGDWTSRKIEENLQITLESEIQFAIFAAD
jgi:hypothetical protein